MPDNYLIREYTLSDQELATIIDGLKFLRNVKYENLGALTAAWAMTGIYFDLIDDYEKEIEQINMTMQSLESQMLKGDWRLNVRN